MAIQWGHWEREGIFIAPDGCVMCVSGTVKAVVALAFASVAEWSVLGMGISDVLFPRKGFLRVEVFQPFLLL